MPHIQQMSISRRFKKRLNWAQLAFSLSSLILQKIIKFLIHSLRRTGNYAEIEKLPDVIVMLVKF